MNDVLESFLLTWLFWWLVLYGIYAALLLSVDALLTARQRRRTARRRHRAELDRIDQQAALAIHRLQTTFVVAQQLVRAEATTSRGGRP
jgi:hypothetical protein